MNWGLGSFVYRLYKQKGFVYRVCSAETFKHCWLISYSVGGDMHPDNWVSWAVIRTGHRLWNGKPLIID